MNSQFNIQIEFNSMFEVHFDENNVYRVITPFYYPETNDKIVVRVRPTEEFGYSIDDNGEAIFYLNRMGSELCTDAIKQIIAHLTKTFPVSLKDNECLMVSTKDQSQLANCVFQVAQIANQLCVIANSQQEL